ncbi:MAG: ribonuclease P protein component [Enterobacterales bacterium]
MNYKFDFNFKLTKLKDFNFVFQDPNIIRNLYLTIFSRKNILTYPRIGISVSKKYITLANKRNRIKRLVRESFRLNKNTLPFMDFVIIIKKKIVDLNNIEILKKLEILWKFYF